MIPVKNAQTKNPRTAAANAVGAQVAGANRQANGISQPNNQATAMQEFVDRFGRDAINEFLDRGEKHYAAKTKEKRRGGRIGRAATFGQNQAKNQDAFARAQAGKDLARANIIKANEEKRAARGTLSDRIARRREIDTKQKEDRLRRLLGEDPASAFGHGKITNADGKTTFRVAGIDHDFESAEDADQLVANLTDPQDLPYEVDNAEARIRRLLGKTEGDRRIKAIAG